MVAKVTSFDDFIQVAGNDKVFVLFYKPGHAESECALSNLKQLNENDRVVIVDVSQTKDIHPQMNVRSVPAFVVWKAGKVLNVIKGCQSPAYYKKTILGEGTSVSSNGKSNKRVIVYSTPSCPYCNKLKQYLNKHGIRYTDINVAADTKAAEEMVRKSGQRGVPQTDINGQIIIGFDVPKISKLLNIPTE